MATYKLKLFLGVLVVFGLIILSASPDVSHAGDQGWSIPQTIVEGGPGPPNGVGEVDIDVDRDENWHVLYKEMECTGDPYPCYFYIRYKNSNSGSSTIVQASRTGLEQGQLIGLPAIAVDSNGNLHVAYGETNYSGVQGEFFTSIKYIYNTVPKLFVVIPGVGFDTTPEHGKKMLERAKVMVRYDDECLKEIREVDNLSDEQVRQMIIEASQKAKEKGKDVIVNIDMDLDGFSLIEYVFWSGRWTDSVAWAGGVANLVSDAFREEAPSGSRILYAHSAGVDAASQSIQQMPGEMMYDDLNLFNGRTDAGILGEALGASSYGWWQVKVFTSKGDYWAIPYKTLSNYDAARQGAGKAWVHLHSLTPPLTGHNGLIENIGVPGRFKINLGSYGRCDIVKTVEEMMLWDWRSDCPASIALERMR